MRSDYGPGYRVYYVRRGAVIVVVLCGGDERTHSAISGGHKPWRQR
jgi:putative addiction module killer protein